MEITIKFRDLLLLFISGEWDVETFKERFPNLVSDLVDIMFEVYLGTQTVNNIDVEYYFGDIFNLSGIYISDKDYTDNDISTEEIYTPLCNLISTVRPRIIEGIKYNSKEDITEIYYASETLSEETLSEETNIFKEEF